jgi:hypothetical protein
MFTLRCLMKIECPICSAAAQGKSTGMIRGHYPGAPDL